jgi:hypothetical protein
MCSDELKVLRKAEDLLRSIKDDYDNMIHDNHFPDRRFKMGTPESEIYVLTTESRLHQFQSGSLIDSLMRHL